MPILRPINQVLWSECLWQDISQGPNTLRGLQQGFRRAVLPQQLPTTTTWHKGIAMLIDTGHRDQRSTARGMQITYQSALSAQANPVRGIFYIAPAHDPAIVNECGYAHFELRVGRIRALHDVARCIVKCGPIDVIHLAS
jgi:hypothetical protein